MWKALKSIFKGPEPAPPPIWCPEWRQINWNQRAGMLQIARGYSTNIPNIPKANIVMVGSVGSGKSSSFNTIDSIFKGRIANVQESRRTQGAEASVTRQFRKLQPGGPAGGAVGFTLCDTMGMEEDDGLNLNDLPYVLDGNVPNNYTFQSKGRITPQSEGFIVSPTIEHRMHCIVYVVDGTKVHTVPDYIREKFNQLRSMASARDIRIVILVTHIDEVCPQVHKSVRNAHKSAAVRDVVDKINNLTGIPISFIFLVKNYNLEIQLNSDVDALNLTALQKILDYSDDILQKFA